VVHHGGAGTSQAATVAGCPSIVVEHASDQPLWAGILQRMGIAPRPLHRWSVTAAKLARTIKKVVAAQDMAEKATAIGNRMQQEDGLGRAVKLIENRTLSRVERLNLF
jgi:UDP:flavonoid glycosyltransferase YjiC (YdhE family)